MTAKDLGIILIHRPDWFRPWIVDYGQSHRSFEFRFEAEEQIKSDVFDAEIGLESGTDCAPSDADSGL